MDNNKKMAESLKEHSASQTVRKIANMAKAEKCALDEYCNSKDLGHPYDAIEALYFMISRIEEYEKELNQ